MSGRVNRRTRPRLGRGVCGRGFLLLGRLLLEVVFGRGLDDGSDGVLSLLGRLLPLLVFGRGAEDNVCGSDGLL